MAPQWALPARCLRFNALTQHHPCVPLLDGELVAPPAACSTAAVIRRLAPWLAAALLAMASVAFWQARFAALGDHPLDGDGGFGNRLAGWQTAGGPAGVEVIDGLTVARFAQPAGGGGLQSATRWFPQLAGARFVHVRLEAQWSVRKPPEAPVGWGMPQLMLLTKDAAGQTDWRDVPTVFVATGSRRWHREEAVFALPPQAAQLGLMFQLSGPPATMEIRDLRVTAVQPRRWIPAATGGLLAAWTAWLVWLLRRKPPPLEWWRAAPGALVVIAGAWLLVVPEGRPRTRPFVGGFLVAAAAPSTPAPPPPALAATPAPAPAKPAAKPPAAPPPPPPKPHRSLTEHLRRLDLKLDLVHLTAFLVLALAVFGATRRSTNWPLLAALAILSELVPDWHEGWSDRGDLLDLLSDLCGIALAAGAFHLLLRKVKRGRASAPKGTDDI